jgi:hypothetical protein
MIDLKTTVAAATAAHEFLVRNYTDTVASTIEFDEASDVWTAFKFTDRGGEVISIAVSTFDQLVREIEDPEFGLVIHDEIVALIGGKTDPRTFNESDWQTVALHWDCNPGNEQFVFEGCVVYYQ